MALIERLMHDASEPDDRWISVHTFFAAVGEVSDGRLTAAGVQNYLEMTAADIVDWDALAVKVTGTPAARLLVFDRFHRILIMAQVRAPGYDTPSAVRAKLGI